MSAHVAPLRIYALVFGALLALTGLTAWIAYFDLGPFNTVVAITIAVLKALLVALYFMHVRWSSHVTRLFVVAGIFWFLILVLLTLSDYDTRSWMPGSGPGGF
jgi:cytochrome c oxidase subunit IV